ncbi:MAG: acyl-CoA dehydrogenase [Rhodospirillaceae bacterium TMED8]|nr:acyl-CoA dehydrogenase [Magnetovibrio sp.]OUT50508.1 MAG: acyl-CoA dehydrogenase [Rhodospirillaceae bacterium TMED8]
MEFSMSEKTLALKGHLEKFMKDYVYPNEQVYYDQLDESHSRWTIPPILEQLKTKARDAGLWNLFLPDSKSGAGLSNLEYAPLCEVMGRVHWAPEVFNCSAPDTGNMETLERFGTAAQREQWLKPLLAGEIRSAFAMTEPKVASSDATNIETSIHRDGGDYVVNGHKWWTSGIGSPHCELLIVMGKTDPNAPKYTQQSMVLVPRNSDGVKVTRMLSVAGFDDAPHGHGEVIFDNVRVSSENILLGEGRGFEIAQGRLGPGRIHHCMRIIGVAERALEMMCKRATERRAFGKLLAEQGVTQERIADSRIEIEMCRLLVFKAAFMMDTVGNKNARQEIGMIKVAAPNMALNVIDRAMQVHGGGAMSQEFMLSYMWARMRALRFADGPDEVHRQQIARLELGRHVK